MTLANPIRMSVLRPATMHPFSSPAFSWEPVWGGIWAGCGESQKQRRPDWQEKRFGARRPRFWSPHFLCCVTKHQFLPSLIVSFFICQILILLILFPAQRGAAKQWSLGRPGPRPGLFSSVLGRRPLRGLARLVTVDSRWTVDAEAQISEAW